MINEALLTCPGPSPELAPIPYRTVIATLVDARRHHFLRSAGNNNKGGGKTRYTHFTEFDQRPLCTYAAANARTILSHTGRSFFEQYVASAQTDPERDRPKQSSFCIQE